MKFLSALILLLSVLALVRGENYNSFKVNLINSCSDTSSLNSCTNQCGGMGGSFKISQSGDQYKYEQFAAQNCLAIASLESNFACLADEAPVTLALGNIQITCEDPSNSASSPLTTAVLFVVAFAATFALLL
ncbi:hypothetical protein ACTFIZ_000295 [Dictyostelium cf. discoideum]